MGRWEGVAEQVPGAAGGCVGQGEVAARAPAAAADPARAGAAAHAQHAPHAQLQPPSSALKAVAGGVSGTACSLACSPLDVARTRAMVERNRTGSGGGGAAAGAAGRASGSGARGGGAPGRGGAPRTYSGIVAPLRHIYMREGMRGWFRGLVPSLVNVPVFWSLYFPMYDGAKELLREGGYALPGPMEHVAGAVAAGAVCDVLTNPLWVLRTRLQTHNMYAAPGSGVRPLSVLECARGILRNEGWRAYYKGLGASLLGLSHVAIQFPLYENFKERARRRARDRRGEDELQMVEIMAAAMGAKAIASTLTYPHEVLRARLQYQVTPAAGAASGGGGGGAGARPYTGLLDAVRQILRQEGVAGMYRGLSLNLVRTLPAVAVTFTSYEQLVVWLPKALSALREAT